MNGSNTHTGIAACHEAGHALASLREGRMVARIEVSGNSPGNGFCVHAPGSRNPFDVSHSSGSAKAAWIHTLAGIRADIRIALAGPLAEAKALGKPLRALGAKSDLEYCMQLATRAVRLHSHVSEFTELVPLSATDLLNDERQNVRRWLAQPAVWRTIQMIAHGLYLKGNMEREDLDRVIGIASNSEGRNYLRFGLGLRQPTGQTSGRNLPRMSRSFSNELSLVVREKRQSYIVCDCS